MATELDVLLLRLEMLGQAIRERDWDRTDTEFARVADQAGYVTGTAQLRRSGNPPLPLLCPCGHPAHGPRQCLAVVHVDASAGNLALGIPGGIRDVFCACPVGPS